MRITILTLALIGILTTSAGADSDIDKAKQSVTAILIDPSSAQFDGIRVIDHEFGRFVCGLVNARNRMGGYTGRKPFVHKVDAGLTHVLSDAVAIYEAGTAMVKPCFPSLDVPPTAMDALRNRY